MTNNNNTPEWAGILTTSMKVLSETVVKQQQEIEELKKRAEQSTENDSEELSPAMKELVEDRLKASKVKKGG